MWNVLCIRYLFHLGVLEWLRFVIVALPGLFSYLFLNFFWPRKPRPYTLATLNFILWLIIMDPGLIYSHQTWKEMIFLWPKPLQQWAVYWCSGWHLLVAKEFWDPAGCSLCIPKRACKIVETLPCEMCNAFAISSTLIQSTSIYIYEYIRFWSMGWLFSIRY